MTEPNYKVIGLPSYLHSNNNNNQITIFIIFAVIFAIIFALIFYIH